MISNAAIIEHTKYYEPALLWEQNENTYAGGTLTFSGNYTGYIVEFSPFGNSQYIRLYLTMRSTVKYIYANELASPGNTTKPGRGIQSVQSNSIVFGHGYLMTDSDIHDDRMVPKKVWGIIG